MDCDLRRPMLHRHFSQQNTTGIISWFEQGAHLDGDILTNPHLGIVKVGENLWLLTSGGRSKSPTELLENPVFPQLLERLKKQFDLVVIDSPPMGAVTDSMLIAERADEVIYVCRFNRAYRKHIKLYIKGAEGGEERDPRDRAERPFAPADRVLLELPLLQELQEILRRADLGRIRPCRSRLQRISRNRSTPACRSRSSPARGSTRSWWPESARSGGRSR